MVAINFVGTTNELHWKTTTNHWPNTILHRSTQRDWQRGIPPGRHFNLWPPKRINRFNREPFRRTQVGSMLINRVADTGVRWHQEVTNAAPRVTPINDLTLDDASVKRAIDNLNFIQLRRKLLWSNFGTSANAMINISIFFFIGMFCAAARDCDERLITGNINNKWPIIILGWHLVSLGDNFLMVYFSCTLAPPATPSIIHEECSAVNNSVTVAWKAPNHSFIEGYVLELDDGSGGEFRVSVFHQHATIRIHELACRYLHSLCSADACPFECALLNWFMCVFFLRAFVLS